MWNVIIIYHLTNIKLKQYVLKYLLFQIDKAAPPFPRPAGYWWFGCAQNEGIVPDNNNNNSGSDTTSTESGGGNTVQGEGLETYTQSVLIM